MRYFQFQYLLLQAGWKENCFVGINAKGKINYLSCENPETEGHIEFVAGATLPGFVNAHSHSFQYAMAGQAETHEPKTDDDFWSWRDAMYSCALSMTPDKLEKVTTLLYQQLVANGYTRVVEFHYLHHDANGKPYHHVAEMGERVIAAAMRTGIKLTLVPIYYHTGDFGKHAFEKQRCFISNGLDSYLKLLEASENLASQFDDRINIGYGPHSLRAVPANEIITLYEILKNKNLPFHVHLSEQIKEVENCQAFLGQRPVEWLLENLPVDEGFNLVHCTHLTQEEIKGLAAAKANVILCPSTEGNLGDGIFPLTPFYEAGGNWAIGTDSQIQLNPMEDIRWLDYAQRLTKHRRNTFDNGAATMVEKLFIAGNRAAGQIVSDYFAIGQCFDAVVYELSNAVLAQADLKHLLSAIVYTTDRSQINGTIINGEWKYKK